MKTKLNATTVYVLSVLGFLCCCFGGIGVFFAGPAFFIANKNVKEADENPENYDFNSVKAMKTAKIVALVVLILNVIYLITTIYRIATMDWDVFIEQQKQIMEQYGIEQ